MFLDLAFDRLKGISGNGHVISVAKAVSWRIVGTLDTFFISLIVTGKLNFATTIASVEVITKIVLYYLHERAWLFMANKKKPN